MPGNGGGFGQHGWTEIHMGAAGWIPVDARTLQTRFEGVYAVGDVTSVPMANTVPHLVRRQVVDLSRRGKSPELGVIPLEVHGCAGHRRPLLVHRLDDHDPGRDQVELDRREGLALDIEPRELRLYFFISIDIP